MCCERTWETIKDQTGQNGQGTIQGTCKDAHLKNEKKA